MIDFICTLISFIFYMMHSTVWQCKYFIHFHAVFMHRASIWFKCTFVYLCHYACLVGRAQIWVQIWINYHEYIYIYLYIIHHHISPWSTGSDIWTCSNEFACKSSTNVFILRSILLLWPKPRPKPFSKRKVSVVCQQANFADVLKAPPRSPPKRFECDWLQYILYTCTH